MLYPCINNLNGSDYNYNNVQMYVMTWGHRFSEKFHMLTESYSMYGRNIQGSGPDGAGGKAGEYGIVNYLNFELNGRNMMSFRNEWCNDQKGQRTGFATRYTSHTLGMTHWVAGPGNSSRAALRPLIRHAGL